MHKHELFFIVKQSNSNPPVEFPETIINGFGFELPHFIQFSNSKIEFFQINKADIKLICICWTEESVPYMTIKSEMGDFTSSDLSLINTHTKNVAFQKFIHCDKSSQFRVAWNSHKRLKLIGLDHNGNQILNYRSSKVSKILLSQMSAQIEYILKLLKKYLHLKHYSELKTLSLDFTSMNNVLYCLGIDRFSYSPILAVRRLSVSNIAEKETPNKRKHFSTNNFKKVDMSQTMKGLKILSKQMRLVISNDKPKAQLLEGIKSEVETILKSNVIHI